MTLRKIKQVVRDNYLLNLAQAELAYRFTPIYKTNPLIIYQMGKVGSETVESSLAACRLNRPIYRAHSLVKEHIQNSLIETRMTARDYYRRSRLVFQGQFLAKQIARDLHRGHWQVISMVRDPIAQNVSSFFQILDLLVPDFESRHRDGRLSTPELMKAFVRHYPPDSNFITWFDVEMKRIFEIDVFEKPFPHEQGFEIYREPHAELLVLRLEDLDRCAPLAFREFLGIVDFRIRRTNEASRKDYAELYDRFRREAEFPASYVDGVYGSKYARTFYTAEELSRFRAALAYA
jgi:hypothetical protein